MGRDIGLLFVPQFTTLLSPISYPCFSHGQRTPKHCRGDSPLEAVVDSSCCCGSITKSCLTLWPHGLQHTRFPYTLLSPRVCSDSCPLSWWCSLTISSSAVPFSFCLQSFPVSRPFAVSLFFTSGSQTIGACGVSLKKTFSNSCLWLLALCYGIYFNNYAERHTVIEC